MLLVEKELFVIPDGARYILYAPTARAAVAVSGGVVRDLQACEQTGNYPDGPVRESLIQTGILIDGSTPCKGQISPPGTTYAPTHVTLCPTSDCGLRCIYCYASAGSMPKIMELSTAKAAVDLIVENAAATAAGSIDVTFHGGGEPLYGKSEHLVRAVVDYAKQSTQKRGMRLTVACATNGVLSMRQLAWMAQNLTRVNLSLDGPPHIQDTQRPLKNGRNSSPLVERTVEYLEQNKVNYGVRSTITERSVIYLTEIVEYLHRIAPSADLHLEPLFSCGRCTLTGAEAPETDQFVDAFLAAREYAKSLGTKLYYSGADLTRCGPHFCGATKGNFCVTPWGDVTSCYEVTLPDDPRASLFFFGKFDRADGAFRFDQERLLGLRERGELRQEGCSSCFMKYACSGDCMAKAELLVEPERGFRCRENRLLGLASIIDTLDS